MGPRGEHVLVTGGAGFIGAHLARALLEENTVTVYDSLVAGKRDRVPAGAAFIEADVRDGDRLASIVADVDRIFHQAALVSVPRSIETPLESHEINVSATLQVLDAARRHDVPVVLASSAAIYGRPEHLPIAETHRTSPQSPYGLEKLTVDHYARLYHEQYGLETVALRYFNVYGPGQSNGQYAGVITTFRDQANLGESLTIEGDGSQTRDFVHVWDVVRANLLAATSDAATGRAFNIGTGRGTDIRSLAEIVRRLVDTDAGTTHVEARAGDIDRSVADISRARSVLGYEPRIGLETGLRTVVHDGETELIPERSV